jgi:MFS family permease
MTGPRSVWRLPGFGLLFAGAVVSELGSALALLALPLVAVTTLNATTLQVGLLSAAGTAAFLLVALPAGVLVDRRRKRPVMIVADLGRMLLLTSVPVAAWSGHLSIGQLLVVTFATGVLSVLFDVAYQSFVPALVPAYRLVEANARMSLPESLGRVAGPSLAGVVVAAVGAARAIAMDSLSYGVNALMLGLIRVPEARPERTGPARSVRRDIADGLAYVVRHPVLRRIAACTATSNLFITVRTALYVVFMVRELHATPAVIGVVFSVGAVGGLIGAAVAGWAARCFGSARMLWLSKASLGWVALTIPLARPGWGMVLVSLAMCADAVSAVVYNVAQVSYRQAVCPPRLLGRMNASIRWIIWGALPLGGLLAGWLGTAFGLRAALTVSALGSWLSVLFIVLSPLVRMRDIPVHGQEPEPEGA